MVNYGLDNIFFAWKNYWKMILNQSEINSIESGAKALNIPVTWLQNILRFESNFNPQAKNPYSSARGILQFIDSTSRDLGYKDSLDLVNKNPTVESQMQNAVIPYLSKYMPFKSSQSLYMSVFYPAARNWSSSTPFPEYVQKVNPGIVTVGDYVRKVEYVNSLPLIKNVSILLTILFLAYKIIKGGKKE